MPDNNYQREARFADTMRKLAESQNERDYWHGYRKGIVHSLPKADKQAREQAQAAYDLTQLENRRDQSRAVTAIGFWDGLRWESLSPVRDYSAPMTIGEWLERYGEVYGISNERHVANMCGEISHSVTGAQYRLPVPFAAEKQGNQWRITRK